ncbi:MAG TPA: FAD-dependent monooxygenase [Burkholderiales bacterium]|nr:FAD-dependent monooxygenase [Burkholderiales bacterium]
MGRETQGPAFRPIVLSYASRLILERIGVWNSLAPTPIDTIHVSQAGSFGRTVFDAGDAGVPALGYVLEYSALLDALRSAVQDLLAQDEAEARCVVHAEGAAPDAVEKGYAQDALVAAVRFAGAASNTAFERFTQEGPLALLPLAGGYAVVWSTRPDNAQRLLSMSEGDFLKALAAAAGTRPGRPVAAQARAVQPLVLKVKMKSIAARTVYIGNAAQTLHPVAGQGLNVGLRDAWDLAQIMRGSQDPGDAAVLQRFAARRRVDTGAAIRITDLLATIFLRKNPLAGAALTALDIFPAPRRFFARRMMFGPSALP